jgi:hypothetical protein
VFGEIGSGLLGVPLEAWRHAQASRVTAEGVSSIRRNLSHSNASTTQD